MRLTDFTKYRGGGRLPPWSPGSDGPVRAWGQTSKSLWDRIWFLVHQRFSYPLYKLSMQCFCDSSVLVWLQTSNFIGLNLKHGQANPCGPIRNIILQNKQDSKFEFLSLTHTVFDQIYQILAILRRKISWKGRCTI